MVLYAQALCLVLAIVFAVLGFIENSAKLAAAAAFCVALAMAVTLVK